MTSPATNDFRKISISDFYNYKTVKIKKNVAHSSTEMQKLNIKKHPTHICLDQTKYFQVENIFRLLKQKREKYRWPNKYLGFCGRFSMVYAVVSSTKKENVKKKNFKTKCKMTIFLIF